MKAATILATATAALLVSSALQAQVRGRVEDSAGHALVDAGVELWSATERVAIGATNARGEFRLSVAHDGGQFGLFVRRIGYRPLRRQLAAGDSVLVLRLEPLALALPTVHVAAAPRCPQREDAAARRRWNAVRAGYSQATDTLGLGSYVWERTGPVATLDLSEVDTTRASLGHVRSAGVMRRLWRAMIGRRGYAWPPTGAAGGRVDAWEYPPLEADFAQHFVDSLFAVRHTFRLLESMAEPTAERAAASAAEPQVLVFCPKRRQEPEIEGTLVVAADGTLLEATWAYVTPAPREQAGGQVFFAPKGTGNRGALLLPIASYFWREGRVRGHYVAAQRYRAWIIGATDSIPELATPREAGF